MASSLRDFPWVLFKVPYTSSSGDAAPPHHHMGEVDNAIWVIAWNDAGWRELYGWFWRYVIPPGFEEPFHVVVRSWLGYFLSLWLWAVFIFSPMRYFTLICSFYILINLFSSVKSFLWLFGMQSSINSIMRLDEVTSILSRLLRLQRLIFGLLIVPDTWKLDTETWIAHPCFLGPLPQWTCAHMYLRQRMTGLLSFRICFPHSYNYSSFYFTCRKSTGLVTHCRR